MHLADKKALIPELETSSRLFSLSEAARELGGISTWTLRKHISLGNIRAVRLGRRVTLSSQEIGRIQGEGLPSLGMAQRVGRDQQ